MEIILGGVVSLLVQWIKTYWKTNDYQTLAIVLGVSLVAAGAYTILMNVGFWEEIVKIIIVAGAIYSYIIRRFE